MKDSYLLREDLNKLMKRYTLPCILSLLIGALYNIVDQIFIANADYLGSYGNAANSVVFPLTVIALALATMIGDGCCAYSSICLGAKKKEEASSSTANAIILVIVTSLLLTFIYLTFSDMILNAFGANVNQTTFVLAKEYFFYISLGIPFYMLGQALNPIIRSDGSPKYAMFTLLLGGLINLILDPILIYPLHMGMAGAAIATIIGQILAAIFASFYLKRMQYLKLERRSFKINFKLVKEILSLGMTSFLSQVSMVFSIAAVNNMALKYGSLDPIFSLSEYAQIPTAVIGIVMKFFQIVISVSIGLAAGCIPIIGYNLGANRKDRVKSLLKKLIIAEAVVGIIALIIFEMFPNQLINIFGGNNESVYYREFALKCIRLFMCLLPLSLINKGSFIFLQAMGKAKESTFLSLLREIILGVGLVIILPKLFALNGLLYFMPLADLITFIITIYILYLVYIELNNETNDYLNTSALKA